MGKNLSKYYQVWELRQQGKKLKEIAKIMGYKSVEWVRFMINYVNYRINIKFPKISSELRKLVEKYVKKT